MGKTKTAFIAGTGDENLTSKQKYEQKRAKKAAEAKADSGQEKTVAKVGLKGGQRIKVVEADVPGSEPEQQAGNLKSKHEYKARAGRSAKYKEAKAKVDSTKIYPLNEAISLVKDTSYANFDGQLCFDC